MKYSLDELVVVFTIGILLGAGWAVALTLVSP